MDVGVILTAFLLILPVELPDKTFVATLVLATRYRPLAVWVGVGSAFVVQTTVACLFGGLVAQLPRRPVEIVTALLFLVGAVILFRGARTARNVDLEEAEREAEEEFGAEAEEKTGPGRATFWKAVGASFLVLFAAEWGDLSQLLTAGLVVRTDQPVAVFIGAVAALLLISGIAAAVGRQLMRRIKVATLQFVGSAVCVIMAVLTLLQAAGLELPF
ncbi:MAG: TMEM165/GDT1 family protein [Actinomycetales bacterium]